MIKRTNRYFFSKYLAHLIIITIIISVLLYLWSWQNRNATQNAEKSEGYVRGKVTDTLGNPIENAVVHVVEASTSYPELGVPTNKNGEYQMSLLSGNFILSAFSDDYYPQDKSVTIIKGQTQILNFEISTMPREELPDLSNAVLITIKGTIGCLPHKQVSSEGAYTMECAVGLIGDDGYNYGVSKGKEGILNNLATDRYVELSGKLISTPESKYDVKGTIFVDSMHHLSELGKAEELIYASKEYAVLTKLLDQIASEPGGSYDIGVHECGTNPCLEMDIYTNRGAEIKNKIPPQILGYEVKVNLYPKLSE